MSVILPPSDTDTLTALLKIVAHPKEAEKRLADLKDANAELLKQQASAFENQRLAVQLEAHERRVAGREQAVAEREKYVAVLKDLERREQEFRRIRDEIRALPA